MRLCWRVAVLAGLLRTASPDPCEVMGIDGATYHLVVSSDDPADSSDQPVRSVTEFRLSGRYVVRIAGPTPLVGILLYSELSNGTGRFDRFGAPSVAKERVGSFEAPPALESALRSVGGCGETPRCGASNGRSTLFGSGFGPVQNAVFSWIAPAEACHAHGTIVFSGAVLAAGAATWEVIGALELRHSSSDFLRCSGPAWFDNPKQCDNGHGVFVELTTTPLVDALGAAVVLSGGFANLGGRPAVAFAPVGWNGVAGTGSSCFVPAEPARNPKVGESLLDRCPRERPAANLSNALQLGHAILASASVPAVGSIVVYVPVAEYCQPTVCSFSLEVFVLRSRSCVFSVWPSADPATRPLWSRCLRAFASDFGLSGFSLPPAAMPRLISPDCDAVERLLTLEDGPCTLRSQQLVLLYELSNLLAAGAMRDALLLKLMDIDVGPLLAGRCQRALRSFWEAMSTSQNKSTMLPSGDATVSFLASGCERLLRTISWVQEHLACTVAPTTRASWRSCALLEYDPLSMGPACHAPEIISMTSDSVIASVPLCFVRHSWSPDCSSLCLRAFAELFDSGSCALLPRLLYHAYRSELRRLCPSIGSVSNTSSPLQVPEHGTTEPMSPRDPQDGAMRVANEDAPWTQSPKVRPIAGSVASASMSTSSWSRVLVAAAGGLHMIVRGHRAFCR